MLEKGARELATREAAKETKMRPKVKAVTKRQKSPARSQGTLQGHSRKGAGRKPIEDEHQETWTELEKLFKKTIAIGEAEKLKQGQHRRRGEVPLTLEELDRQVRITMAIGAADMLEQGRLAVREGRPPWKVRELKTYFKTTQNKSPRDRIREALDTLEKGEKRKNHWGKWVLGKFQS